LSHRTSRGGGYGRETGIIDLGHEPPLSVDGSEAAVIDRRRVSVQWFSGTILTGLCGAALIGGAVFASLDGEMTFAKVPERVEGALRGAFGANDKTASLHKSDRLPPPGESTAARSVVRVSTVARVGNRDVMRVRPFVRISGNLSMTTSDLSSKIPPFNAQRMLSDVGSPSPAASDDPNAAADAADAAEPDAEVSFVTKDLAPILPKAKVAAVVALDDILMRVRDASNWRGNSGVRYAALANAAADATGATQSDMKLAYATEGTTPDPYAGFETRVVPENVTLLPKTKDQVTGGNPTGERIHLVKKGDSVTSVLRDQGATPEEAKAIAATLGPRGRDGGLKEGEKLRILMAPAGPGQRLQPYRVIVANDSNIEAVAALSDLGKYVAVDVQSMNTVAEVADNSDDEDDDGSGVRLYQSIYETALRNKVPSNVIEDMVRIYSYDVDFQRKVQPGDSFDVFYAGEDEGTNASEKSEVLYASLTVGGETKKYYRFQTPDDAVVDYYDETGKSAKKFLVRKPVSNAIMRSGFGGRRHPILGFVKMHTGVDWATAYGTPIFASGNGVVEKAGPEGGYGKYVRIKHSNGYETAYGHMSAFAKGLEVGKRVRQGQVIGFVGSTGLSTGPHVHYEILVNGRFVDPMRIKLPRGRSLDGTLLAGFEKERDRLDGMMNIRGTARISDATGSAGVRQISNR
jgi:murein DD-endopeptidase MepM/ murein hydrolase activator NlpD